MHRIITSLGVGFLALTLIGVPSAAKGAELGRAGCLRGDRILIQDLDLSPDPIIEGQRLEAWRVRLRFDGRRECETEIEIREGREVVGRTRRLSLRPGIN